MCINVFDWSISNLVIQLEKGGVWLVEEEVDGGDFGVLYRGLHLHLLATLQRPQRHTLEITEHRVINKIIINLSKKHLK